MSQSWPDNLAVMDKKYRIELSRNDLGQLLDGLEVRAEAWERTARFLLGSKFSDDDLHIPEECHKPEEATGIAEHYRQIISEIRCQLEAQEI